MNNTAPMHCDKAQILLQIERRRRWNVLFKNRCWIVETRAKDGQYLSKFQKWFSITVISIKLSIRVSKTKEFSNNFSINTLLLKKTNAEGIYLPMLGLKKNKKYSQCLSDIFQAMGPIMRSVCAQLCLPHVTDGRTHTHSACVSAFPCMEFTTIQ